MNNKLRVAFFQAICTPSLGVDIKVDSTDLARGTFPEENKSIANDMADDLFDTIVHLS